MANIRRSAFPARSRRLTDWGFGPQEVDGNFTSTVVQIWSQGVTPIQNFTIMRTRGWWHGYLTAATVVGDGFRGAVGIYMMTTVAFAIGPTAALGSLTEANLDMWLWHSFFDLRIITATIADGVNAVAANHRIEIDSKAMRKDFDPERVLMIVKF